MMNISLKNPFHFIALGFGAGLIKPAPGTWGSLVGVLLAVLFWQLTQSALFFLFLTLFGFLFGCYCCEKVSRDLKVHDDGRIVWDEIVAIWLIFSFLPQYHWLYYSLSFIVFRFFDILKPAPIRYFDTHLKGGFGIMFDDILAALYSIITLYLIYWIS